MNNSVAFQTDQKIARANHLLAFLPALLMIFSLKSQAQEKLSFGKINPDKDKILIVTNRDIHENNEGGLVEFPKLKNGSKHLYYTAKMQDETWTFSKENSLSDLVDQKVNYSDWVVFVHGDGKTLQGSVERAREIQKLHKVNVLVYSWPSKDEDMNGIKNFKNSYQNVELSAPVFYSFLQELNELKVEENPVTDENLTLFLHSLGNYYLERLSVEGLLTQLEDKLFNNLVINAAAVEQEGHHVWVEQINFAERIYINSNDDDMSLSGLRVLTRLGRQLGESALEPFASNAIYVNFTEAVGFPGMGPSHSYYFASVTDRSENIRRYFTTILHGNKAELFDEELFTYVPDDSSYYIRF